jgi:hypothetical protein
MDNPHQLAFAARETFVLGRFDDDPSVHFDGKPVRSGLTSPGPADRDVSSTIFFV